MTNKIIEELIAERTYQDARWGTDFDDKNTLNDWISYTNQYITKGAGIGASSEDQRKYVLKAATILVAALEAFDRNNGFPPRHYD
jgi:hypothetical protein